MRVELTLRPGQRGTKKLVAEYGSRLIAVRYRADRVRGRRVKTVELSIGEWEARPRKRLPNPEELLLVRVAYSETALRQRIRMAGGKWNTAKRGWELRRGLVEQLGLESRVMGPAPAKAEK